MERIVTCSAPVNIAVIKYWGKADENLILPLNDSISFTLNQDEMCATTTVVLSPRFTDDRFWLNHSEENFENPRILNCLKEVHRRAGKRKHGSEDSSFLQWHLHIYSVNNFPTAAGLASSAAGYACLVFALGKVFNIEGDLSSIARLGSGSACRSLYGGMVQWYKGNASDGTDSFAQQIAPADHWPDLHVLICVANDGKKKTGSTEGMRRSVDTSFLMKCRIKESVIRRTEQLLKAVTSKDWSTFCDLTMADSNEMHAVCLDTFPPCVYMNDTSHAVSDLVHKYNKVKMTMNQLDEKVCYTFDAGPNACLFVPGKIVNELGTILNACFPFKSSVDFAEGSYWQGIHTVHGDVKGFENILKSCKQERHSMKYFIHTKVGDGPRVHDGGSPHLLDKISGLPKAHAQNKQDVIEGNHTEKADKINFKKDAYCAYLSSSTPNP